MSLSIRILFGTETGNAEDCAQMLGSALSNHGYNNSVTDMVAYTASDLANESLVLIVTSTYGNGDPPYNAEEVMAWLTTPDASVDGVPYAVCGLGDRTYPKFGQAGKDFDRLLEDRGGVRVVPRIDCDVDYEEPFEQFQNSVLEWLNVNADALSVDEKVQPVPEEAVAHKETAISTSLLGTRSRPVEAIHRKRRRLNRLGSNKETIHYEFEWPGNHIVFEPGDSLAVTPTNNPNEVAEILSILALDGGMEVVVDNMQMTLHEALTKHRDLQTLTADLIEDLFGFSQPEGIDPEDHLLDVLTAIVPDQPDAQKLVNGLRKMKPRLYSVASSPLVTTNGVHFTVETLRYEHKGRVREGVATTWLADRVCDGETVQMYVVQAPHFRAPQNPETPVIMIGPGTGIAPFRGFLQHRKAQSASGKNWLFFGHQHRDTDFLYEEEINQFVAEGVLTELSLAWSRDQEDKVYVQHLIANRSHEIWTWLQEGACVYVCGDKLRMAPQVRAAFISIAENVGGLSDTEAESLLVEWEQKGRYSVDAY